MDEIKKYQINLKYRLLKIVPNLLEVNKGKFCGTWGEAGCFSSHPLKNLIRIGDGGFVVTNSLKLLNLLSNKKPRSKTEMKWIILDTIHEWITFRLQF